MANVPERVHLLIRFYGVGVINTLFGYSLFFGLLAAGLNIYVAQAVGHLIGMAFNYLMFRRHVFTGAPPAMGRYVASYAVNYLIGLALIMLFAHLSDNKYVVGLAAALTASMINFVILKRFVFTAPTTAT